MPVVLMITGVIVVVVTFIFAAANIGFGVAKTFRSNSAFEATSTFGGTFWRHILAMIGVLAGGAMFVIGLILFISSKL